MHAIRTSGVVAVPMARIADTWYGTLGDNAEEVFEQMTDTRGPRRPINFVAPASTCAQWDLTLRHIRETCGENLSASQCVAVLVFQFLQQWGRPELAGNAREYRVYIRDGWRCLAPHCGTRAWLHAHHIVYRSRGGPDSDWNLVTVCMAHHALIHAGAISVRGRVDRGLVWSMGISASGDVRDRFVDGTRVECNAAWLAGVGEPTTQSARNWRAARA